MRNLAERFPIGAGVSIDALTRNRHAVLHRLRATEPVSWLPALEAWLVTRHDLTIAVMRDAKTFTVDHPGFSTAQVVGPSMLSLDGAAHVRERRPFEQPFRRRAVNGRFRQPVADFVDSLLGQLKPAGQAELRRAFAGPVAVQTMLIALGMEGVPIVDVLGWYDAIVDAVTRVTAGEPVSEAGKEGFVALQDALRPSLAKSPETNLLAAAAGAAAGLSEQQIVANAAVLLFGGIETTEGMIANALYFLLTNPEVLAQVKGDEGLLAGVIEESLRLEPAAAVVDRYATVDVTLGGAEIKAGELVRVSLAGANRDTAVFPDPDRFDPTRKNLASHVAFAQGPHVCLGLHLARLETALALGAVLRELDGVRLVDVETAVPQGLVFRKPVALDVVWGEGAMN